MESYQTDEKLFKHLVQSVSDYAIFALDPSGTVVSWNKGAERIKGYKANEIIGKSFTTFYTEEEKKRDHPAFELKQALKNGAYEEEGWRIKKDGSQFWASVIITTLHDNDGTHLGFAKVTRDLTERKLNEIRLEEALDQALLANKAKSEFVANITHEIRTPLAGIIGLSELIARDENVDSETREAVSIIFDSSKLLLGLLNDLLDFSKLEAGKANVDNVLYSPKEIINDIIRLVRPKIEQKHLEFAVRIADNVPKQVFGDSNKVRQILLNLISNALKFTESGGIEIFVEQRNNNIYFSVTDTGIGVLPESQDKLFQPFSQAHNSTARLYGGTGLGLSIAQQYVQLMNGEIGLFSQLGRGSTFWFVLPINKDQEPKKNG